MPLIEYFAFFGIIAVLELLPVAPYGLAKMVVSMAR